jgi:hypothetical protein
MSSTSSNGSMNVVASVEPSGDHRDALGRGQWQNPTVAPIAAASGDLGAQYAHRESASLHRPPDAQWAIRMSCSSPAGCRLA